MKLPPVLEPLAGKTVVMLAATLRPETMYGQTNCWILPHEKDGSEAWYGVYETHVANEVAIVGEQAARNMAFQGLTPAFGNASPPAIKANGVLSVVILISTGDNSLCSLFPVPSWPSKPFITRIKCLNVVKY